MIKIAPPTLFFRSPKARSLGRSGPLLAATIAFSLVSIWVVFGVIAYETYRSEWQGAALYSQNLATLIERDIARTIEIYDLSIKASSIDAENPEIMALRPDLRNRVLFDSSANASGLGTLIIVDKTGKVVTDSRGIVKRGTDFSDRDYFSTQRDHVTKEQPFISRVFKSRVTGQYMIGVSRPVIDSKGAFDGVVVGTISSEFLSRLFSSVQLPAESSIQLTHEDGTLLLRIPLRDVDIDRAVSSKEMLAAKARGGGEYVKTSAFDGVERLFSLRRIGTLPIYVKVGLSTRQLLAHWVWRAQLIGLALISLTAISLFLAWTLAQELKRRGAAERKFSELAATDSLTLLANRRAFDETLDSEWRRAIRESTSIALLMIDSDFFKAFNDTYGHLKGDHALKVLADTMAMCVERPADLVARFGGEEFVVLLPATGEEGANTIALAIRHAIADVALPHATSPFGQVTVSIGIAVRRPTVNDASADLIEAADAALYTAKAEGRDRIVDDTRPMARAGKRATPAARIA